MYQRIFVLLFCAFSAWNVSVSADTDCPLHRLTLSYKSLNCLPVKENGAKCPTSYDCSAFESRDKTVCHVRGKTFNVTEDIDTKDIKIPCITDCFCDQTEEGHAFPNCTYTECPFAVHIGCDNIRRADQCCSSIHCGKRNLNGTTCTYEEETVGEGDIFYSSKHKCKTCTCTKDFKGVFEEPHCSYMNCNIEIYRGKNLYKGCAPVFYEPLNCCPFKWICPTGAEKVIESKIFDGTTSAFCKFGNLTVPFHGSFNGPDNIDCVCDLPPYMTCSKRGRLF